MLYYVAMRRFHLRKHKNLVKIYISFLFDFVEMNLATCSANFSGQTEDHPDLLKYSCKVDLTILNILSAPPEIYIDGIMVISLLTYK